MSDNKNNTGNWNTGYWNTGDRNTGNGNTGDWNTGYRNTGDWNTGYGNTGYRNTGDWNTGNWNTGNRNTGNRNTGNRNAGNWNTGDWNTGNGNTGDRNTGYGNAGNWNTGDWNTTNRESGFFNTEEVKVIRVFNKPCSIKDWDNADKPSFLYFNLTEWIYDADMTDQEKADNPTYKTTGGYLKSYDYKEAFQKSYNKASEEDKALLLKLPNFDAEVFKEISGIDVTDKTETCNGKVVEIDGKKYQLREVK